MGEVAFHSVPSVEVEVPEPGTLALVGASLLALCARRRGRAKRPCLA
jgi:hypothetical protein